MDAKQSSLNVLMFPWLAHGHVYPYLELAKKLSKRDIHIYFCSTAINLDSIRNSLKKDSDDFSIELVELRLPSHPELPPHYHTTKNVPPHLRATLMKTFQASRSSFPDIITNLKPHLLIFDVFQPWSAKIASSLGIPAVHFVISCPTSYSLFHHLYTHRNYDTYPFHEAIRLREYEVRSTSEDEFVKVAYEIEGDEGFAFGVFNLSRDVVLIKSCCREFEGKYTDYLSKLCQKKVVPTGPLIAFSNDQEAAGSEIMNWLSEKNERSTLYISLGSENYFTKDQIWVIAKGLEICNVNFIWIARSPLGSDDVVVEDALPQGFLERVKHRGMMVQQWAPQTSILAHPSVGGFMTHCGFSSVTESIYSAVPVVALPLKFDQPVISRFVVEAGIGVEVMRDEDGGFNGETVAKAINEVIAEESGERLRRKVRELSLKMKMEEEETFDQVVEELSSICVKKYRTGEV